MIILNLINLINFHKLILTPFDCSKKNKKCDKNMKIPSNLTTGTEKSIKISYILFSLAHSKHSKQFSI